MIKKQLVYIPVSPKHELPESGVWVDTDKGQLMHSHNYGWLKTASELTKPPLYWYKQELFYCLTKEELEDFMRTMYTEMQTGIGIDAYIQSIDLK